MSFDWIRGKNPSVDGLFVWCLTDQPHHAWLGSNCIPIASTTEGEWAFWDWKGVRNTSADAIWVGEEDPEDSWEWESSDPHILRVWDRHEGLPHTGTSRSDAEKFVSKWLEDHEGRDYQGCDNWISCKYFSSAKWFQRYAEQDGLFCILKGQGRVKEKDEDGNLISMFGGGVFCSLICWEDLQKFAGEAGGYSVGRRFMFNTDAGVMSFLDLIEKYGVKWDYDSTTKTVTIK